MRVGTELRWRPENDVRTLGFDVYRVDGRRPVKLNWTLVPISLGIGRGRTYTWLDGHTSLGHSLHCKLRAVGVDGTRNWLGAAAAHPRR